MLIVTPQCTNDYIKGFFVDVMRKGKVKTANLSSCLESVKMLASL